MKAKILSVFSILFLACLTSCEPVIYDTFGGISGYVIETTTGEAVSNALVTLSPSGLNTYTGSDGFFQFSNLEAGQYTLTIQSTGYSTNRKTINIIAGSTVDVSLTLTKK